MGMNPYAMGSMCTTDMTMYPFLQEYRNRVSSLCDSDMMSLNGSIYPNFTGTGAFNYDQYYEQMRRNQDSMMDNNLHNTQRMRQYDFQANSAQLKIKEAAVTLHEKICQNEQDQVKDALNAFINTVKETYAPNGGVDDIQILAYAEDLYKQTNGGKSLRDDIRENGHGSFVHGFLQSVTFGLYDNTTPEENISNFTGQPVGNKEKAYKKAGNTAGGMAAGATTGAIVGGLVIPVIGAGVGAIIGGAIGGIIGFNGSNILG